LECVKEKYLTPRFEKCIDDDLGHQSQCDEHLADKQKLVKLITHNENAALYEGSDPFSKFWKLL
jgi:hypothetical protein